MIPESFSCCFLCDNSRINGFFVHFSLERIIKIIKMPISSKETKAKRTKKLQDATIEVCSSLSIAERKQIKMKKLIGMIEGKLKLEKDRLSKKTYEKDMKELSDFAAKWVQDNPKEKESGSYSAKSEESAGKVSIMEIDERDEKIISSKLTEKDGKPILRETMTEEKKEK